MSAQQKHQNTKALRAAARAALRDLVREHGQNGLARKINGVIEEHPAFDGLPKLRQSHIQSWLANKRRVPGVPGEYAVPTEIAVGVPRTKLRPDIYAIETSHRIGAAA